MTGWKLCTQARGRGLESRVDLAVALCKSATVHPASYDGIAMTGQRTSMTVL